MFSRINNLKIFFKDSDKKNWYKLIKECIHFAWIKKELPTDYFRKFLYRNDVIDYTNYLSLKQYKKIVNSPKILISEIADIMDNKLSFACYCKKSNLPVPKLISHNSSNIFYFDNTVIKVNTELELISFFENVLKKSKQEKLFLKPLIGGGGYGCILLEKKSLHKQVSFNANFLFTNSFIHQEVVNQHPSVSEIYSKAINTLRIDTYLDNKNKVHILSVAMRFGIGESITDNASSGGFYVSTNMKIGALQGIGRQDAIEGGNVFLKHPNTNIKIDGFKIPYYMDALNLVMNSSEYFPTRLIGWDIAISAKGPVIIEANPKPSLHMTGVAYGGYNNHSLIKTILKEIKT